MGVMVAPAAAAEESDVRVVAVYDAFTSVPGDEAFVAAGLTPGYRFAAIPAIILGGPSSAVESLRGDITLTDLVYDGPLEFHMETAVAATRARDVWGMTWHPGAPSPLLKDGVPIDGRGVTVGIVDSGANGLHPDLWYAPLAVAPGVTPQPKIKECVHTTGIVGPVTVPTPNCDENVGHGTHVAGIVAGTGMMADMGFTVSGVSQYNGAAPGASLAVAGLGVETVALGGLVIDGLAGLDWQYRNADLFGTRVVTNSWSSALGCTGSWNRASDAYYAITDKLVQDKKITVLWAANNDGGTKPIGTSNQGRNTMPGVIMVANYDDKGTGTRDGDVALSSGDGCIANGGTGSTTNMIWTWPDVAAPGSNIVSTATGIDGAIGMAPIFVGSTPNDAPFYTTLSGTSMATPHVAGVAALMYQAYPEITPAQVERILIETAMPWADNVANRGVIGTAPYWGPASVNNAIAGFADPTLCRITPAIAARADANDATLDATYPGFREMVQPRLVNGQSVDIDAGLYVCRDFKRGHGLVDAHAAVLEALELAGDDDEEILPSIEIDIPAPDEVITEAQTTVSGIVDLTGDGANAPPTAALAASATNGPSPLAVDFSLAASDADGAIVGYELDFGDGSAAQTGSSLPAGVVHHEYTTDGEHVATLTVTDDEGASAEASVDITVGGLPATNELVTGTMHAYYTAPGSGAGLDPWVLTGIGLGIVDQDNVVPFYTPGQTVRLSARAVKSTDGLAPVDLGTIGHVMIFEADGRLAAGPIATTTVDDSDAVSGAVAYEFSAGEFDVPLDWSGRYLMALRITTPSGFAYMSDSTTGAFAPIDVIGPDDVNVPGLPGSEPGGDEGHSIGDADDDGVTPVSEIEWADVSTDADSVRVVMKIDTLPPLSEDGTLLTSPTMYAVTIGGVELQSYLYGLFAPRVWDATSGAQVPDASTSWDVEQGLVTIDVPLAYLSGKGVTCPCMGHVESQNGQPFLGVWTVVDRAPDAGERDLRAAWKRPLPTLRASSSSDPENTDPTGDAPAPHIDVTKVWVSRETATEVDITLQVADLASAPPSFDAGNPARASWNYGVDLCVNNAAQTYTPTSGNFAGVAGVVCYRLSAANGVLGVQHSGGGIQKDGSGSCGVAGLSKNAVFNTAASTVTWTLDLASMTVSTISAGVGDCTTAPQARNAPAPTTGNVLSRFAGRTGFSGPVLTAILDDSTASAARPYTLGGTAPALVADAGADLSGSVGDDIAIVGSATGGTAPYTCAWSAGGATFADAGACATSVSFASAGMKTLTLTVTDSVGASAMDTASVDVASNVFERVEVVVGGSVTATAPVDTSGSDTDAWSVLVDVSSLPRGETDIVATWYGADGEVLASATRSVILDLDRRQAIVDITSPGADSQVSGESIVAGVAGHTDGSEGGDAQLNSYGLPIWSGLQGGRASETLSSVVLVPCATCQPGKPVQQVPNAAWDRVQPVLSDNLATSVAWQEGPGGVSDGLDGTWLALAGHGGDAYELIETTADLPLDIRFYANWEDADTIGENNGPAAVKTGTVPSAASWAFVYLRRPTQDHPDAAAGLVELRLTKTVVPPGVVQGLAATSGPGTIALSWSAPVNDGGELLGYKLMRDGADLATVATPGYVDTPGDTAEHVYAVIAFNSAGESGPTAIAAAADDAAQTVLIASPLDGALGVAPSAIISGTYAAQSDDATPSAFANTHYVALLNLNSPCGDNLGYGDHVIFSKLASHAVDKLGVPARNVHIYNEQGVALEASVDAAHYNQLPTDWKTGAAFDGPARWSVFAPALRSIADDAAAAEAAGGAPARIFFLQSSHGLQASVVLGDGATDSVFCLIDGDVSSTMLGDLLNDIDADAAADHEVSIEWSVNIDCSFCGGFVDSPLPAPGVTAVHTAGVVGPNRVVEVGCTWVTECFGNPAVTYDHMFNQCVFTGEADGYGPIGAPLGPGGEEIIVGDPAYASPDGVITLEESYWCAIEASHEAGADPIATQQMFQINDQVTSDLFGLDGFPLWEADSSLDLSGQDAGVPLDLARLPFPDTRASDPEGDGATPFTDLVSIDARATTSDVLVDVGVADLTISSLELEDVVEYRVEINGDAFGACYSGGSVLLYGYDIPSEDPVTGEPTTGDVSSGTAVYDTANGIVAFTVPLFELNDATLPAEVSASSHAGECSFAALVADDTTQSVLTSEEDDETTTPTADKVTLALDGPASLVGPATLNAAAGTWSFDPPGDLAEGEWSATATYFHDDGTGFVQIGAPASVQFTVGVATDVQAPSAPVVSVAGTTTSSVELSWTASSDDVGVDHYEVLRDGASVGTTSALSFVDDGLASATVYEYVVKAYDAAGNSAAGDAVLATTGEIEQPVGIVTLRAGDTILGTAEVDTSAVDPASWEILVDWSALPDGATDIVADYDDGAGLSASDALHVVVTRAIDITIDSPAAGENVLPTFTVRGTADGTGGPDGVDAAGYMFADGTIDKRHPAYQLAQTSALASLGAALAGEPGFLGVGPDLTGDRVVRAWFTGAAPEAPAVALPEGWTLTLESDVKLEPAIQEYPANYRVRQGPPTPGQTSGIGPGSHLIQTRPDGTFGCTANFIWRDQSGKHYLGAAGHCFLPVGKTTTHGAGRDYDPALTSVKVCVSACQFGGQAGFLITGNMVQLGKVAYSRQTAANGNLGNDFGIVEIPEDLYHLVHAEMPIWNGPNVEGTLQAGEPVLLYGNAEAFGAVWPTMARAGFGSPGQNANMWSAVLPSAPGDSGGALVTGRLTDPAGTLIEGHEAIGALTHIVLGGVLQAPNPFPIAGTTMVRAKAMASEAGLTITPLMQGETARIPDPTPPGPPTLQTLSPGSTSMGLQWSAPVSDGRSPITGYKVGFGTSPGMPTTWVSFGSVTSGIVEDLVPTTRYYFVVKAVNAIGESMASNELDAFTQAIRTAPTAPRDLVAFPDNGEVILTWDAPESDGGSPITGYLLAYAGGPAGSMSLGDVRTATVTGLTNGVEYTFTVSATNEIGQSPASNAATATPNGPLPPAYTVELRAAAEDVEVLAWTEADGFDGSSFTHEIANAPGGALTVTARLLQDGVEIDSYDVTVHVLSAPVVSAPASVAGNEREAIEFIASATDADGPNGLTFSLVDAPEGATIGGASGAFRWTPTYGDAGTRAIAVQVTDPDGLTDVATVELVIGAANRPPVLDVIGNRIVGEGELLSFPVTASDHENDALTFAAAPLPAGATFEDAVFSWTPAFGEEGNYEVTFSVTDALQGDEETIMISVGNVNRPPVLDPIGPQSVPENALLALTPLGSDPDAGSLLAYSASGLPVGATFVEGVFLWSPNFTQAGAYPVTFRVTDGELEDTETVVITVTNVDRAPTLLPILPASVLQLSTVRVQLRASDPDAGDAFSWSYNGPEGATIEPGENGRATLVWTPGLDTLGPRTFTVIARSGPEELVASRDVTITVRFKTDFAVTALSPSSIGASPGETIPVSVRITNTGPQTDTLAVSFALTANLWRHSGLPASVTLAPGQSVELTASVVVPETQALAFATLEARSVGDGTTMRSARFRLEIPLVLDMSEWERAADATDVPRAMVRITHLDGTPAVGAQMIVDQSPDTTNGIGATTLSGFTDANGEFEIDFTGSPGGLLPGKHVVTVRAKKAGGLDRAIVTSYVVGRELP